MTRAGRVAAGAPLAVRGGERDQRREIGIRTDTSDERLATRVFTNFRVETSRAAVRGRRGRSPRGRGSGWGPPASCWRERLAEENIISLTRQLCRLLSYIQAAGMAGEKDAVPKLAIFSALHSISHAEPL